MKRYALSDIKIGQLVRYRHGSGGISCCHNGGTVEGEGIVTRIFDFKHDPPIGIAQNKGDKNLHCVFANEIVEIVHSGETV